MSLTPSPSGQYLPGSTLATLPLSTSLTMRGCYALGGDHVVVGC